MKLHFGDPKKSASLPRAIAPLVILSRHTSALLYPARSTPESAHSHCESVFSQKQSSLTGRSCAASSRRTAILRSGMIYFVAIVMVLLLPLVLPLAMTQVVQLVDRTQKWAFDKRIRDRLARDLSHSVFRRQEAEQHNVTQRLRMDNGAYSRAAGDKSDGVRARDGHLIDSKKEWFGRYQAARQGGLQKAAAPRGRPTSTVVDATRIKQGGTSLTHVAHNVQQAFPRSAAKNSENANARPQVAALSPYGETVRQQVEARLRLTFKRCVLRWLSDQGCRKPALGDMKLKRDNVPITLELLQRCGGAGGGTGALCVTKRQKMDVARLQGARSGAARVVLGDEANVFLSVFCDGSLLNKQWMTVRDLKRVLNAANSAVVVPLVPLRR